MERILCVCNGGNVRSSQTARMLKKQGYEVLNCAWKPKFTSSETLKMLCEWANIIFVASDEMVMQIPASSRWKASLALVVGKDVWGYPTHPALVAKLHLLIADFQRSRGRDYVAWEDNGDEVTGVAIQGGDHPQGYLGSPA